MLLVICDVCGRDTHAGTPVVVGQRKFFLGRCCEERPFRVPEPLAATVIVRRPDGTITAYEVSSA